MVSHTLWTLGGATAYLGLMTHAAVLDIGLVFPRANETYEPTDKFPVVFAIQNPELAEHLIPTIQYGVLNASSDWDRITYGGYDWSSANFSGDGSQPYLFWTHHSIDGEGPVRLMWQPSWSECDEGENQGDVVESRRNSSDNFLIDFEIRRGGKKADLTAATAGADDEECPGQGFAIEVSGETRYVPRMPGRGRTGNGTCAVLEFSSPTPTANPCRVKIDKAAVESMEAVDLEERCRGVLDPEPGSECAVDEDAGQKMAVAGAVGFAALLGAGAFLLT